jgi:hypothetical protein
MQPPGLFKGVSKLALTTRQRRVIARLRRAAKASVGTPKFFCTKAITIPQARQSVRG